MGDTRLHAMVLVGALMVSGSVGALAPLGSARPISQAGDGPIGYSHPLIPPCDQYEERYSKVSEPPEHGFGDQYVATVTNPLDGEEVQIGIVRPDVPDGEEVPVIVKASPYFWSDLSQVDLRKCQERLTENFVPQGYAVAYVAIPGTADSGGCFDLMGDRERAALDEAITFLGTRDWSNGNVSMIGLSYDGSTPWEVAAQGNPHLKTIVPISGVNDVYHLMFRNGTPEFRGPVLLNGLYHTFGFAIYNPTDGRSVEHTVQGATCREAYEGFVASVHSSVTGERDPLGYWAERNSRPGVLDNYEGSILLVQGLQDWNVDPAHQFPWIHRVDARPGVEVKYMLGQWGHAEPDDPDNAFPSLRWDWADILNDWFERQLKGNDTADVGPTVQVEDSTGQWRNASQWPPADASQKTLYLSPGGSLDGSPSGDTGSSLISTDAGYAWSTEYYPGFSIPDEVRRNCATCAYFSTPVREEALRVAGRPRLDVEVTPTGPGGDLGAYLYEAGPDAWERLGWGQVDLRFADGGEQAETVTPGEPMEATVLLEPLDAVVRPGHRLVLVLAQGGHADHVPSPLLSPIEIRYGEDRSTLRLETVPNPAPEDTFTPPEPPWMG